MLITQRGRKNTEQKIWFLCLKKQPVQRFTSAQAAKKPWSSWINVGVAPSSTVCRWQKSLETFPPQKNKNKKGGKSDLVPSVASPTGWRSSERFSSVPAVEVADPLLDVVQFGLQIFTPALLHLIIWSLSEGKKKHVIITSCKQSTGCKLFFKKRCRSINPTYLFHFLYLVVLVQSILLTRAPTIINNNLTFNNMFAF